jgi:hypothetical protein
MGWDGATMPCEQQRDDGLTGRRPGDDAAIPRRKCGKGRASSHRLGLLLAATFVALLASMGAALLSGCIPAVYSDGVSTTGPRLAFELPEGWSIRENLRWFGSQHVALAHPSGRAVLSIDLVRGGRHVGDLPLDLLAETFVGDRGRTLGIETAGLRRDEVLLAGRRAIALTGTRHHGPQVVDFTSIVARTDRELLVVFLHAPRGEIGAYVGALERIMDTLSLPADPAPPDRIEEW